MNVQAIATTYCPSFLRPAMERVNRSAIGTRLARGVFWSLTGTVISQGLTLCATILVARILGKSIFGELGMVRSTVGMFGIFAGFGIELTATKYVAELCRSNPARAGRIIGLSRVFAMTTGGLIALVVFLLAPWMANSILNAPHLVGILRIAAFLLLVTAVNGSQTGALAGFEAFQKIARINLLVGLFSFPVLVAGAYFGGLTGVAWGLLANLCLSVVLNFFALRHETRRHGIHHTWKDCGRELSILWRFSLPAMFSGAMVGPVNWLCCAMLVNQPGGYDEMGVFSVANQWYMLLLFLPGVLGRVILPVFSAQLGANEHRSTAKAMKLAVLANLVMVTPIVVVGGLLSPYIMALYGRDFVVGWPTLVITLVTAGLYALRSSVGAIITASGRMWSSFAINAGWAAVYITGTYFLVHRGAIGLASARLIACVFLATCAFVYGYVLTRVYSRSVPEEAGRA